MPVIIAELGQVRVTRLELDAERKAENKSSLVFTTSTTELDAMCLAYQFGGSELAASITGALLEVTPDGTIRIYITKDSRPDSRYAHFELVWALPIEGNEEVLRIVTEKAKLFRGYVRAEMMGVITRDGRLF